MKINLKRLIAVLTIGLLLSCNQRHITIYDTYYEILNGKVKVLTEISKYGNGIRSNVTSFDKNGNATDMITKGDWYGLYSTRFSYKYNKSGRKTEVIMIAGGRQQVYKCDTNGRIAEERFNSKDYDFDKEDFAKMKEVFKYDARGYLKELKSYIDTLRTDSTTYRYNTNGFLSEIDEFNGTMKKPSITVEYSYPISDEQGNWVKRIGVLTQRVIVNSKFREIVERDTVTRKITYY